MDTSARSGVDRLLRVVQRTLIGLAALAVSGLSGCGLGFMHGYHTGSAADWEVARIQRDLNFKGSTPVEAMAPGSWAQVCAFGYYQSSSDAPPSIRDSEPWIDDREHVTIILIDGSGFSRSIRLPWKSGWADPPNCVPVGKDTMLFAERAKSGEWVLQVGQ
jgi:hypothetical protein